MNFNIYIIVFDLNLIVWTMWDEDIKWYVIDIDLNFFMNDEWEDDDPSEMCNGEFEDSDILENNLWAEINTFFACGDKR